MALKVSAPVWYDGNNAFLKGALVGVGSDAIVVGTVQKPNGPSVPPFNTSGTRPTLFVKDKTLGGLYLNMTRAEWIAAVAQSSVISNPEKTYTITITGPPPANLTAPELYNATINSVSQNGVDVEMDTISYSSDPIALTGTISGLTIGPEDTFNVLYHLN